MHRVEYSYKSYSNSRKATEYSRAEESDAIFGRTFLFWGSIGAVIYFLIRTFGFFWDFSSWKEFLIMIGVVLGVSLLDFYSLDIHENNIDCEARMIIIRESNSNQPEKYVNELCKSVKKMNRKRNAEDFGRVYPVFLALLCDAIALIGWIVFLIKLINSVDTLPQFVLSTIALGVFSFLFWKLKKRADF